MSPTTRSIRRSVCRGGLGHLASSRVWSPLMCGAPVCPVCSVCSWCPPRCCSGRSEPLPAPSPSAFTQRLHPASSPAGHCVPGAIGHYCAWFRGWFRCQSAVWSPCLVPVSGISCSVITVWFGVWFQPCRVWATVGENFLYVFKPGRHGPDAPPLHPVGLENSMQRPDLRSSCADRSWMIVGCCRCQSCTGSCAVCWV
jgi:hypothetical protein